MRSGRERKRSRKHAAVLLAAILLCGAVFYAAARIKHVRESRRFTPVKWKTAKPAGGFSPRYPMVRDLMKNTLRVGMPRSQVTEMLGKADYGGDRSTDQYFLGLSDAFFDLDTDCLIVN